MQNYTVITFVFLEGDSGMSVRTSQDEQLVAYHFLAALLSREHVLCRSFIPQHFSPQALSVVLVLCTAGHLGLNSLCVSDDNRLKSKCGNTCSAVYSEMLSSLVVCFSSYYILLAVSPMGP